MNKVLNTYNKYPIIQAAINAIPYAGGAISSLIEGYGNKTREARLVQMLTIFDNLIQKSGVTEEELEKQITNEEFYDLFVHTAESCIKTRHEIKIEAYSNILFNQITKGDDLELSSELMVATLDSITIDEIEYLSELCSLGNTIRLHRVFGELVDLNNCIATLQDGQINLNSKDSLPESCRFKLNLDIVWKFLSDKNIIKIENNNHSGNQVYSYGGSHMRVSTQISYSETIIYSISEFGSCFLNWIRNS